MILPGILSQQIARASCASCLGAWNADIAEIMSSAPLTVAGTCGHTLSSDATAGAAVASAPASIAITWPTTEARLFAMRVDSSTVCDTSQLGISGDVELSVMPGCVFGTDTFQGYTEFSDTAAQGQTVLVRTAGGAVAAIDQLAMDARVGDCLFAITGDGKVILSTPNYTLSLPLPAGTDTVTLAAVLAVAGTCTGSAQSSVTTDASAISGTFMSLAPYGVTAIKDFCGNDVAGVTWLVNKRLLALAISDASPLVEANYTPASWAVFSAALDDANTVFADAAATQGEVDGATSDLATAQSNLTVRANFSALEAAIAASDAPPYALAYEDWYTSVSWSAYRSAYDDAVTVDANKNSTQAEVDDATTALNSARGALEWDTSSTSCSSSVGAFTASDTGVTIEGECGHIVTADFTASSGGGPPWASAISPPLPAPDWPADEMRVFAAYVKQNTNDGGVGYSSCLGVGALFNETDGTTPLTVTSGCVIGGEGGTTFCSGTAALRIDRYVGMSHVCITPGQTLLFGLGGDGYSYFAVLNEDGALRDDTIIHGWVKDSGVYLPSGYEIESIQLRLVPGNTTHTGSAISRIITDAAQLPAVAMPAGITVMKDFSGAAILV